MWNPYNNAFVQDAAQVVRVPGFQQTPPGFQQMAMGAPPAFVPMGMSMPRQQQDIPMQFLGATAQQMQMQLMPPQNQAAPAGN